MVADALHRLQPSLGLPELRNELAAQVLQSGEFRRVGVDLRNTRSPKFCHSAWAGILPFRRSGVQE
eukprot:15440281-Alexandrium_andersonii.AAC.1